MLVITIQLLPVSLQGMIENQKSFPAPSILKVRVGGPEGQSQIRGQYDEGAFGVFCKTRRRPSQRDDVASRELFSK